MNNFINTVRIIDHTIERHERYPPKSIKRSFNGTASVLERARAWKAKQTAAKFVDGLPISEVTK